MTSVESEQNSYEMPPRDGFTVAHFLTVADIDRAVRFYETVFGSAFPPPPTRSAAS
jgi:predicted enzyme related to lactoylglutathione lyase